MKGGVNRDHELRSSRITSGENLFSVNKRSKIRSRHVIHPQSCPTVLEEDSTPSSDFAPSAQ